MFRAIPMICCTIRPAKGPATKTSAIRDLVRPREMRYGDATQLVGHRDRRKGCLLTIGHLNGPQHLHTRESNGNDRETCPRWSEDLGHTGPLRRAVWPSFVGHWKGIEARHDVAITRRCSMQMRRKFTARGSFNTYA